MAAPLTVNGEKVIPTLWTERILKREFDVVLGKMLQPAQAGPNETEEPYLRSANIQWEGVDVSDVKTMWFSPKEKRDLRLQPGDLLVNEGGDMGRCAVWDGDLPECYFQNAINRIRPRRSSSARFLYYWLYNLKQAGFIDAIVARTTIGHLTAEKLEGVPWPDVPSPEQGRIAAYLDAICAAIDAAVATKQCQVETLGRLRKTTINVAVTQGCDQRVPLIQIGSNWFPLIPSAWRVVRFKSLFRVIYRYPTYFNIEYVPEGIPEVRGEALTPDGFIERLTDERYISAETGSLFPMTQLEIGDIVMSVRGTMGKIGIVDERYAGANITANLLRLSPDRNLVTGEFLRWVMRSIYFNEVLNSSAPQTTIKTITMPQLAKLRIALPPRPEQEAICDFLETKITEIKRTTAVIKRQIETLLAYRKSLIHECVTGQRRVTEADIKRVQAHG